MAKVPYILLAILLIVMPGCPGAGNPFVGTWIITVTGESGIEVHADGSVTPFQSDPMGGVLAGELRWMDIEGDFVMHQLFNNSGGWVYGGALTSGTEMAGYRIKYVGNDAGNSKAWSAVKQ